MAVGLVVKSVITVVFDTTVFRKAVRMNFFEYSCISTPIKLTVMI